MIHTCTCNLDKPIQFTLCAFDKRVHYITYWVNSKILQFCSMYIFFILINQCASDRGLPFIVNKEWLHVWIKLTECTLSFFNENEDVYTWYSLVHVGSGKLILMFCLNFAVSLTFIFNCLTIFFFRIQRKIKTKLGWNNYYLWPKVNSNHNRCIMCCTVFKFFSCFSFLL